MPISYSNRTTTQDPAAHFDSASLFSKTVQLGENTNSILAIEIVETQGLDRAAIKVTNADLSFTIINGQIFSNQAFVADQVEFHDNLSLGESTYILSGKILANVTIGARGIFQAEYIGENCQFGQDCQIGQSTFIHGGIFGNSFTVGSNFHCQTKTMVGDQVSIKNNCSFAGDVCLENNCLICDNCALENCRIGANSVFGNNVTVSGDSQQLVFVPQASQIQSGSFLEPAMPRGFKVVNFDY